MIAILYSQTNVLCMVLLLLIYIKVKSRPYEQTENRIFSWVLLSNCLFFATDALWAFVDHQNLPVGILANWALNTVYYILSSAISYIWFVFSEQMQNSILMRKKPYRIAGALPMLMLMVLTLTSVKTGWLFYIDRANVYHRGPLYGFQLLLSYGYVIFTALTALLRSRKTTNYEEKKKYRMLAAFVVPTLLAGVIQVFLPGISLLCVGTTVGIFYIFLTMQEQMISADSLTGLNNRNRMMQHLSGLLARDDGGKAVFLLMMDLDYFKRINDTYGHVEGDRALQKTATALRKSCRNAHYFLARYGGDEFAVLCELNKDEEIENVCQAIHQAVREESADCPYTISLSIGYAKYDPSMKTEQDFIKQADAALYKVKRAR